MKNLARLALSSLASGLLFVVACASSEDLIPDEPAPKTNAADSGGATLPPPSNTDAGPPKPTDAGKDAKADAAPVNTGAAPACGSSPTITQIGEILGGSPGPCDSTCNAATKCCFDIFAFIAGGGSGSLPGFDAGTGGGGNPTGLCVSKN